MAHVITHRDSKIIVQLDRCTACKRIHRRISVAKGDSTVYEFETVRTRRRAWDYQLKEGVSALKEHHWQDGDEGKILIAVTRGELSIRTTARERATLGYAENCILAQNSGGYKMSYVVLATKDIEYAVPEELHREFVHKSCAELDDPKVVREALDQELSGEWFLYSDEEYTRKGFLRRVWQKFVGRTFPDVGYLPVSVEKFDRRLLVDDSYAYWYGGVNSGGNVGEKVTVGVAPVDLSTLGVEKACIVRRRREFFNHSSFRHNVDEERNSDESFLVVGASADELKPEKVKISSDPRVLAALQAAGLGVNKEDFTNIGFDVENYQSGSGVEVDQDHTSWYGGPNSGGPRGWRHKVLASTSTAVVVSVERVNATIYQDGTYPIHDKVVVYLKSSPVEA